MDLSSFFGHWSLCLCPFRATFHEAVERPGLSADARGDCLIRGRKILQRCRTAKWAQDPRQLSTGLTAKPALPKRRDWDRLQRFERIATQLVFGEGVNACLGRV